MSVLICFIGSSYTREYEPSYHRGKFPSLYVLKSSTYRINADDLHPWGRWIVMLPVDYFRRCNDGSPPPRRWTYYINMVESPIVTFHLWKTTTSVGRFTNGYISSVENNYFYQIVFLASNISSEYSYSAEISNSLGSLTSNIPSIVSVSSMDNVPMPAEPFHPYKLFWPSPMGLLFSLCRSDRWVDASFFFEV